jgi:serine/threonine protein kinase
MKYKHGKIILDANEEYCNIDAVDYVLTPLDDNDLDAGVGINGSVFTAVRADSRDEPGHSVFALKVCSYVCNARQSKRFSREIKAMKLASESNLKFVVKYYADGLCSVSANNGIIESHQAILMEKAEMDLKMYFERNETEIKQRFLLCYKILQALKELHDIGVYHRDIKPENVLFMQNDCKLGDLGLIRFRDDDGPCDGRNEKIGPAGFMCPEAINKKYSIRHKGEAQGAWQVEGKSDVYQVAKLIWCILFGSIPNGNVKGSDLGEIKNRDYLYGNYFKKCLLYNQISRPSISDALTLFVDSAKGYL